LNRTLATACLICLPLGAAAQDDDGPGYLTRLLQDNLSGDERIVNIQGFQGALSSEATVARLTVADSDGVWLTMENVVLDWNRSALLRGSIDVRELSAELIRVERGPLPSGVEIPDAEAQPFTLPELPVSISLEQLAIQRIELGEAFLGEEIAVSLTGEAALANGEGAATIAAQRLDGVSGEFVIDGSYSNETNVLALNATLDEEPGGLVAKALDLPGQPAVLLSIEGTGPLSDFTASLNIATDGDERLAGQLALETTDDGRVFALNAGGDVTPLFVPEYQEFFGPDVSLDIRGQTLPEGGFALSQLELSARSLTLEGEVTTSPSGWPERIALTGSLRDPDGNTVLLPAAGPKTYVDNATLDILYDRSVSNEWSASLDIRAYERPGLLINSMTLDGGGQITPGGGETAGSVTADLDYVARGVELEDAGAAEALGGEISGDFILSYTEGQPIDLSELTLRGPGLEMLAAAQIDPDASYATDASILLDVQSLNRFSGLAGRDLQGAAAMTILATLDPANAYYDLLISGETTDLGIGIAELDPYISGDGILSLEAVRDTQGTRLNDLQIRTPEAEITANADLSGGESAADFRFVVNDLQYALEGIQGPGTISGTASQGADGAAVFDVALDAPGTRVTLDGNLSAGEDVQTVTTALSANVTDISRFNRLTGQSLAGDINLSGNVTARTDASRFDVQLSGDTQGLQTGIAELDPLLDGEGALTVSATKTGDDTYAVETLQVTTPAMRLAASGTATGTSPLDGPLDVQADLTLNDAGMVAPGLSGPLRLNASVAGDGTTGVAILADLTAPGTDVAVDATLSDDNRVTGTVSADIADLAPYSDLARRPLGGSIDLTAQGFAMTDASTFDLTLTGTTADLETGIDIANRLLAGPGTVAAEIARTGTDTFVIDQLNVSTPALTLDTAGTVALSGESDARIDLSLTDAGDVAPGLTGPARLVGTVQRGTSGGTDVNADLSGQGLSATVDVTVADDLGVSGDLRANVPSLAPFQSLIGQPVAGGVSLQASGSVDPDLQDFNIDADVQTSDLRIGNDQVDQLLRGTGTVSVNASRQNGTLTVQSLNAQTANVTLSGSLSDSSGRFDARLRDVGLFTDALSGPVTATGTANVNTNGSYGVDVDATGPGGIAASANGTIQPGGNLNLNATGSVPLELANSFIEPRNLTGTARFDLAVNGPPALSSVTGEITTTGATLSAPSLGQALDNINTTVSLNGTAAQVSLTGDVRNGGGISLAGPVVLSAPYSADLTANLNDVVLRDPNLYETTVNGQITVSGPLTGGARIAGTINVGATEIQVPSSGIGALGDLPEVQHIGASGPVNRTLGRAGVFEDQAQAAETGSRGGPAYPLDITVNAPSRIFIRGRGLDAELGGSLRLTGTTDDIVPIGQFELVRGRLGILQQRFELNEGGAFLQGGFIPFIRLVAVTETATGTTVLVIIEGPANEPEVRFESTPDLPQDEVLSQLIFGRDLSQISPLQAVQLAAAVGTLAGRGGGGIVDGFRQNLGLDDFDVTTDEEGNAAVRAGKYLSDNVYTDVTINAEGETEINLNLDVTSEITAKGSVDAQGESSIGIFFERDY
jgi:translocation and assembly module TamB